MGKGLSFPNIMAVVVRRRKGIIRPSLHAPDGGWTGCCMRHGGVWCDDVPGAVADRAEFHRPSSGCQVRRARGRSRCDELTRRGCTLHFAAHVSGGSYQRLPHPAALLILMDETELAQLAQTLSMHLRILDFGVFPQRPSQASPLHQTSQLECHRA